MTLQSRANVQFSPALSSFSSRKVDIKKFQLHGTKCLLEEHQFTLGAALIWLRCIIRWNSSSILLYFASVLDRYIVRQIDRQIDRYIYKWNSLILLYFTSVLDRQTDRQIDRQIVRYIDRQKDRYKWNSSLILLFFASVLDIQIDRQIARYIDRWRNGKTYFYSNTHSLIFY